MINTTRDKSIELMKSTYWDAMHVGAEAEEYDDCFAVYSEWVVDNVDPQDVDDYVWTFVPDITNWTPNKMKPKTFFISDGTAYRNARFSNPKLSMEDRNYLRKTTRYTDNVWTFFSQWEEDFRILHMPVPVS